MRRTIITLTLAVLAAILNLAVIALCAYLRIRKISKQKANAC